MRALDTLERILEEKVDGWLGIFQQTSNLMTIGSRVVAAQFHARKTYSRV